MNEPMLSSDDPLLTAYALGELSGAERATVEAALRQNPALRIVVEEIRAMAVDLDAAFSKDPGLELAAAGVQRGRRKGPFFGGAWPKAIPPRTRRRRVLVDAMDDSGVVPGDVDPNAAPRPIQLGFPHFYYVVGAAAAACFTLLVALWKPAAGPAPNLPTPGAGSEVIGVVLAPPAAGDATGPAATPRGEEMTQSVATAEPEWSESNVEMRTFLLGGLGLLAQVRRELDPLQEEGGTVELSGLLALERRGEGTESTRVANVITAVPAGTATTTGGDSPGTAIAAASPGGWGRPAAPIAFTAIPPAHPELLVDTSPLGTLVSGSPALAVASPAAPGSNGRETVVLSAMRVTASRAVGFALPAEQRSARGRSGIYDRDYLPRPPPGAKFARGRETFAPVRDNEFVSVLHQPLSTFSIDVDTASYADVRRIIAHGSPPPRDAVRIEELLNYFPYRYAAPRDGEPIAANLEVAAAPWAPKHRLVRIGLKARDVAAAQRPAASLVFLLDVSSSMNQPNKLPLVKQSLRRLIGRLRPDDRVAIVTYSGHAGLVLPSTPVAQSRRILNALDALTPEATGHDSTGIQLAYDVALAGFRQDGTNRIVLCTDGDFDVGIVNEGDLFRFVEHKAQAGVFLSVLGFGMGNYRDVQLEQLARAGSGDFGYVDTHREAEKLLVEQVSSTLVTVARDMKVQVEFNPARVASYRLIGYENRLLRREDFNLAALDAGEIGAGHTVTALYEVVPVEAAGNSDFPRSDEFQNADQRATGAWTQVPPNGRDAPDHELLTVKVRYKRPDRLIGWPRSLEFSLVDTPRPFGEASADFRFAAAVAQFGMIMRGSTHRGAATMDEVAAWALAASGPGDDPEGYRHEFIDLVRKALTMVD